MANLRSKLGGAGAIALTFAATGAAFAQETPASDQTDGAEIVVSGHRQFLSADTSGTTGLPISIEKVPQSISLLSPDFLKAANLKTLRDIADYVPGALNAGNLSGESTVLTLRGFPVQQSIDGINIASTYEQDYAIYKRIELVKGPSSVVFGVSSPGGVVNFVTKGVDQSGSSDYLYTQGGSYNNYRIEGQYGGSLDANGNVKAVIVGVHDRGDSFVDSVNHRLTAVYGGLDFRLTDTLRAYIHAGFQRSERRGFDGIPTFADGTPAPVDRSFFIGSAGPGLQTDAYLATSGLTYAPNTVLEFNFKGLAQATNAGGTIRAYGFGLQDNGDISFNKLKDDAYTTLNYGFAANGTYRLDNFGLKDSFVTGGVLYQNSHYRTIYQFFNYDGSGGNGSTGAGNIFAGDATLTNAIDAGVLASPGYDYILNLQTLTFTGQTVVQPLRGLSLLLGGSYSIPRANVTTGDSLNGDITSRFRFSKQFSGRAGVTYEVLPRTTAYFSFSQSFLPQQYIDANNKILPPLTGEQYEVGLKYKTSNNRLLLTAALYEITQSNAASYDQTINGTDRFTALGKVRHRGGELQATGQITPDIQLSAGYAYLDAKILADPDPTIVGKRRTFLPHNSASLFTTYAPTLGALKNFSVGGGLRYVGSEPTAYDGSTRPLPSYVLADALAGYQLGRLGLQLNVRNIFDKHYYTNTYSTLFYGNQPGEPRSFVFSARFALGPNH